MKEKVEGKNNLLNIFYGLTLLDLISLLVNKRVRFYGNRKAQVMKALFKMVRQHVEKKNEKYAFQTSKI
jgi:hypothetical protein